MTTTTLNISSSAIKYLVLKGNGANKHGSAPPAGAVNNGSILQPEIIAGQLKSLFASRKLPRDRVICSINGLPFSYRLFTLPKMEPEAFKEALLRATRKEMPVSLEEMYLSWQVYPGENNEWQVLVTGITRQPVDNLLAVLAKAGISPSFLDLQQLSLARLAKQKNVIVADFEKDYSNIVMLVEGVPVGMQIVPSMGPEAELQDEVRQVTDRINKMVEFYNGSHPQQPIQETIKILVTGELISDDRALKLIGEESSYPVEPLNPENSVFSGLPLHEFAANAGSTLMDGGRGRDGDGSLPAYHYINLGNITRERKASKKSGKTLVNLAVPLAIVVGIGALVPSYLSRSDLQASLTQLRAEMAQANTQYNQVLAAATNAKSIQDNINEIETKTQKITSVTQALIGSKNYMKDISFILQTMPDGVSYTSLSIGDKQITINGDADDASPVVQFSRNLEGPGGYTRASVTLLDNPHKATTGTALSFTIVIQR